LTHVVNKLNKQLALTDHNVLKNVTFHLVVSEAAIFCLDERKATNEDSPVPGSEMWGNVIKSPPPPAIVPHG
jgi:hypothetical protein